MLWSEIFIDRKWIKKKNGIDLVEFQNWEDSHLIEKYLIENKNTVMGSTEEENNCAHANWWFLFKIIKSVGEKANWCFYFLYFWKKKNNEWIIDSI